MDEVLKKIQAVLDTDVTILLEGETGTGKELAAKTIHFQSQRKEKPFVTVNCAAIPDSLVESEFFGHVKGAFTGAEQDRPGKFELADGGTLFLDEVGDLSFNLQAKLLRALQDKQITRLGANTSRTVNVRIIAATNKNLLSEMYAGKFREDLYYRLAVFPIHLPPLRERGNDILILAQNFLEEENSGKKKISGFTPAAQAALIQYTWPGNVRELQNVIKRAYILAQQDFLDIGDLNLSRLLPGANTPIPHSPPASLTSTSSVTEETKQKTMAELEKVIIRERITAFNGNISQAAKSLGLTRATVYKKMKP
jgi:transcriptional regulator with GAF, ATPase, and Fis domain